MAADNSALNLSLPIQVVSLSDVSRLEREIESINDFFEKSSIQGADAKNIPQISLSMRSIIEDNNLNIIDKVDRKKLTDFIVGLKTSAQIVNISFAVEPKPEILMKLLQWFRTNAGPNVLLRVGLQPNIAAGCIVRTQNKYFDLSFKHQFSESKSKLAQALSRVDDDRI